MLDYDLDPKWTRKRDGQTDRQTDNRAKNNMSPYFMGGGDIMSNRVRLTSKCENKPISVHTRNVKACTVPGGQGGAGGGACGRGAAGRRAAIRAANKQALAQYAVTTYIM